jgi:hypothetical protein
MRLARYGVVVNAGVVVAAATAKAGRATAGAGRNGADGEAWSPGQRLGRPDDDFQHGKYARHDAAHDGHKCLSRLEQPPCKHQQQQLV